MSGLVMGLRRAALAVIAAAATTVASESQAGSAIDWGLLQPTPNLLDSYTRGFDQGRKIAAARAAQQAEAGRREAETTGAMARDADQQRQVRARAAGRMIADGKCRDARSYALLEGDLDLALQVAKLCPYAP
jgi:hypothetical protein